MNVESAIVAVLLFSLSLWCAVVFVDVFMAALFWLLGVLVCVAGVMRGE